MLELPPGVDVLEALRHEMLVRNFNSAAGTLFAYDVLINFDVELEYIWAHLDPRKQRVNLAPIILSLLYLVQRYLPFIDQVILTQYFMLGASTQKGCMDTFSVCAWILVVGVALSETMLALRIWAVWARSIIIAGLLVVLTLGCSIISIIYLARFIEGIQYPELGISGAAQLQRCFYVMTNKDLAVPWILLMVYDMVGFILMAIPGFKAYRTAGNSNLIKVVYRDGVIYYALIFMVSLINVIVILILPTDLILLISGFERILHSILASHAILHLRKIATQDHIQTRDLSSGMMTTGDLTSLRYNVNEYLPALTMLQTGFEPGDY